MENNWLDYIDIKAVQNEQYLFKNNLGIKADIPTHIKQDMEIYNEVDLKVKDDIDNIKSVGELERFRNFKPGFLMEKGVIYADSNLFSRFPALRYTSLAKTDNGMVNERYLLPIRLPNGLIFTYMGYSTGPINRYIMPKVMNMPKYNYSQQASLFGNLESLSKGTKEVYFAEGFFDAYRIESEMEKSAVSILGSKLSRNKYRMLKTLKERLGKVFIYVPDFDENKAGLDENLLRSDLWDSLYNFNKGLSQEYKDIDQYYRMERKYYV